MFKAYAATEAGGTFQPFEFDPGPMGTDEVEIAVDYCGICHSDLSMVNNEWGMTAYPFVGGHEIVGRISAVGEHVPHLNVGDEVGLGWFSRSCMHCDSCMSGSHNLCSTGEGVIVGRHGGFADKVRCHWSWATPIPEGVDLASAGPLFCGGITVFNPIVQHDVSPTDRVGVIGIGGLGHMALMFLNKWGCEVTAFSRTGAKEELARKLGAHEYVATEDAGALDSVAGHFDLIINTTNAALDWDGYVNALRPQGVLHTVGAVAGSFGVSSGFSLLGGQKSLSASPLGSPITTRRMVEFCARHSIAPVTETFALSDINDAFEKLRTETPGHRLVLQVSNT